MQSHWGVIPGQLVPAQELRLSVLLASGCLSRIWGPLGEGQEGTEYILEQWLFIYKYRNASIFTACTFAEYLPCLHHHHLSYLSLFTLIHQSPLRPSSLTCRNFFYTFHFIHGKKSLSREDFSPLPNPFLFLCWFEASLESSCLSLFILTLLNDFFLFIFLKKDYYFYILKIWSRWLRKYSFYTVSLN